MFCWPHIHHNFWGESILGPQGLRTLGGRNPPPPTQLTIKQQIVECQPASRTKQELIKVIEAKLSAEFPLAPIRQNPSIVGFEVAKRFSLSRINKLNQERPEIDNQGLKKYLASWEHKFT